jgi:hypothetical protein
MRILYDNYNPATLRSTTVERDEETGLPLIVHVQDTRQILEANKRSASSFDPHRAKRSSMVHVARIPLPEWIKLTRLGITRDERALNGYLNMRETRAFRCDDGRKL